MNQNYFYPDDFRKLPIPNIDIETQNNLAQKAEQMMFLKKQIVNEVDTFITIIQAHIKAKKDFAGEAILTISLKLKNFYEYDFSTYYAELLKLKVRIPQKELPEWKEYFDVAKKEINELNFQSKKTEEEINRIVFDIYGLTASEIEVVENIAVKKLKHDK